ncbi:MAG: hypothetical protein GY903_10690 [Fuerstiella sp.]|nr:hypothetical protein [Fuerstiella sp.]
MRAVLILVLLSNPRGVWAQDVPQSVQQTWADFDPRSEPLEAKIIRESIEDGIVLRHVRYVVGTWGKKKTRVAVFYAFPKDGQRLPGIVQLHGGGQRTKPHVLPPLSNCLKWERTH